MSFSNAIQSYMQGTSAKDIPMPPNSEIQAQKYLEERENELKKKKEEEKEREEIPSRAEFEENARQSEQIIEQNTQNDEFEDENQLEEEEFSNNYFDKPTEQKEKLGDQIRNKYNAFSTKVSDNINTTAEIFGSAAGLAAEKVRQDYKRFKRGDPILAVSKAKRQPKSRYISKPGRNISRPYVGSRFGDYDPIGFTGEYTSQPQYYQPARQSQARQSMDTYLPNGRGMYDGEFSAFSDRTAFRENEIRKSNYDPFGFGALSGNGYDVAHFGDTLMGFGGKGSLFSANGDHILGDMGRNMQKNQRLVKPKLTTSKSKKTSAKKSKKSKKENPQFGFSYF